MTTTDWALLSLHLAALLLVALVMGQAARRIGIPTIVGEIAVGCGLKARGILGIVMAAAAAT